MFTLKNPNIWLCNLSALTSFGDRAWEHHEQAANMTDDIDTRPYMYLLIVAVRYSTSSEASSIDKLPHTANDAMDVGQQALDYWLHVHNGRRQDTASRGEVGTPIWHRL